MMRQPLGAHVGLLLQEHIALPVISHSAAELSGGLLAVLLSCDALFGIRSAHVPLSLRPASGEFC